MYMAVDLSSSVADVLAGFHGSIVVAEMAYPEVLHVEVRDERGQLWRLATQDARWSPLDPAELRNQSIVASAINRATGELKCQLANGSEFVVTPEPQVEEDDPPNWELFTPGRYMLEFGPGSTWQIVDAKSV